MMSSEYNWHNRQILPNQANAIIKAAKAALLYLIEEGESLNSKAASMLMKEGKAADLTNILLKTLIESLKESYIRY